MSDRDPQRRETPGDGRIRSGKLAGRSLGGAIWILALPVLFQQLMQACVGMVDKVLAGALPDDMVVAALDGLGIGSYVGWFINIALVGLGVGGQALIARAMGAGRVAEGERALGQALTLSMIWGAVVGAVLWIIAPWFAAVCRLDAEAATFCVQYVRIFALAMPLCGVMQVGSMCLYGAGETLVPSLVAVVVNAVNVVLSWVLSGADVRLGERLVENPFAFDLHVAGIALGTAAAYAVGAGLTVLALVRGVKDLRLRRAELPLDGAMVRRIVRVGLPNFFEGLSMWAVNLFVLLFIGMIAARDDVGTGLQGAHIIAVQWEAFSFLPGFAIGTAAGALAGQYLGAGNPAMAQRAVITCTVIAVAVMGLLGVAFLTLPEQLTAIVSSQPVHLEQVPPLLRIAGAIQVFFAVTMVVRQGLRGVGDTRWTLLITTASSYGVRLPAAYLLGVHFGLGLTGIWLGLCGELVVRSALFTARFVHGGWKRLEI